MRGLWAGQAGHGLGGYWFFDSGGFHCSAAIACCSDVITSTTHSGFQRARILSAVFFQASASVQTFLFPSLHEYYGLVRLLHLLGCWSCISGRIFVPQLHKMRCCTLGRIAAIPKNSIDSELPSRTSVGMKEVHRDPAVCQMIFANHPHICKPLNHCVVECHGFHLLVLINRVHNQSIQNSFVYQVQYRTKLWIICANLIYLQCLRG